MDVITVGTHRPPAGRLPAGMIFKRQSPLPLVDLSHLEIGSETSNQFISHKFQHYLVNI